MTIHDFAVTLADKLALIHSPSEITDYDSASHWHWTISNYELGLLSSGDQKFKLNYRISLFISSSCSNKHKSYAISISSSLFMQRLMLSCETHEPFSGSIWRKIITAFFMTEAPPSQSHLSQGRNIRRKRARVHKSIYVGSELLRGEDGNKNLKGMFAFNGHEAFPSRRLR